MHPEFVKPSKIIFVDNTQSVADIIDDEDIDGIVNPFENSDDLKTIIEISASADGGPRSPSAHARRSARPPINTSGNFPAPVSAE